MHPYRPIAAVLATCGMTVLCLAGCTPSSSTSSPTARFTSASPTFDARSADPIRLSCADAGSGNVPTGPDNLATAGLILEGLAGQVDDVSPATQVGLGMPAGSDERFRKAPAYLPAGTAPITVELIAPMAGEALAWVPAAEWTGGGRPHLASWMATRVTFDGCPDRDATYFGGVLANQSDACLHLRIQPAGAHAEDVRLRLDRSPC